MRISDHDFVTATVDIIKPQVKRSDIKYRKMKDINEQELNKDLQLLVEELKNIHDHDTLVSKYNKGLKNTLDKHAPMSTKRITHRERVPWFTETAAILKRKKRKIEKLTIQWPQNAELKSIYHEICKIYRKYLERCKWYHLNTSIKDSKGNCKKLFKSVYDMMGIVKPNPLPKCTGEEQLAEDFCTFFLDKIRKIREPLDNYPVYEPTNVCSSNFNHFGEVSQDDVIKVMKTMRPTTCSTDPVPSGIVKDHLTTLAPVITDIVNTSLLQCKFGHDLKTSTIIPLIKKSTLEPIYKNYRPVNTLPFISKVIEKMMLQQFNRYCEEKGLTPDELSAYRANHSTELCMLKLHNDLLLYMDSQKVCTLAMLDLSAAFDTVDHDILLKVMQTNFGVKEPAISWFENYLRPRWMQVKVRDAISTAHNLPFSTPQGSCAGPNLFNAYASTVYPIFHRFDVTCMGYADDHLGYQAFSPNDAEQELSTMKNMQECLMEVNDWMCKNRLKNNLDKAEFMLVGNTKQLQKCTGANLQLGDITISKSKCIKYLGVYWDSGLTFKQQIKEVCNKTARSLHLIRQIRRYLTKESAEQMMVSLILSKLDYANSLYYGLPDKTIKPLQRIQNAAAKCVLKMAKADSNTHALRTLHWLPVKYRIIFKILTVVYTCTRTESKTPAYIKALILNREPPRELRSSRNNTLHIPKTNCKTYGDRSLSVTAGRLWNNLPEKIKNSQDLPAFKKLLKTYLFNKAFR